MPEGHVSHRNALRLTAALAAARVVRVDAPEPRLGPQRLADRLTGERVERVEARGKHHLLRFVSGRVLHSHLGMVGSWRLLSPDRPLPHRGLWLALATDVHVAAQYRGPRLRLYEPGEAIPALRGLGVDLLDTSADPGAATVHGLRSTDPGRPVGEALLDQRVVSGIGNVIRSETLFLCGIEPWRPVGSLGAEAADRIGRMAGRLLADGVARPGPIVTIDAADPRGRERTWVYGRAGRPCRRCGTPVRSAPMGERNRVVYWCPACQPRSVAPQGG